MALNVTIFREAGSTLPDGFCNLITFRGDDVITDGGGEIVISGWTFSDESNISNPNRYRAVAPLSLINPGSLLTIGDTIFVSNGIVTYETTISFASFFIYDFVLDENPSTPPIGTGWTITRPAIEGFIGDILLVKVQ